MFTVYKTDTHSRRWLLFGDGVMQTEMLQRGQAWRKAVGTRRRAFDDPAFPSNQVAHSRPAVTHEHQRVPVPSSSPHDDSLTGDDRNAWSECFLERFCHRECGCGFVSWTVVSGVSIRGLRCDDLIKPHICYGFEVEEKREPKWLSPHQFWPHPPSPITPKRMEKKRRQEEGKRREEIERKEEGRDGKGKRKRRLNEPPEQRILRP